MAEVLGLILTVGSLVELAGHATMGLRNAYQTMRDAPESLQRLSRNLDAFYAATQTLLSALQSFEKKGLVLQVGPLDQMKVAIDNCHHTLRRVQKTMKLDDLEGRDLSHDSKRSWREEMVKRLRYLITRPEVNEVLNDLEREKSTLSFSVEILMVQIMVADRYPILNAPARKKTMEKIDSLTDKLRETAIPASQTITAELLTEEPAVDAEEPGNEIEDTSCVLTTQVAETMEALIPQGKEAESVSIPDSPTIQSGGHEDTQVDAGQPKILGETPESENSCSALKGGNIEPDPLLQFEFMMAVMDGNLADVQRLLGENRHQLDIDEVEPGLGQPPITVAIVFNHVAMVKVLIAAGANVDIADNKGCAPLAHAMQNGNTNLMKILLDAGADKMPENPPKWGLEPPATYLFQSVKIQRKDMLELLLDAGVDAAKIAHNINRGSWAHETSPLVVAVGFHHDIGIARRLLEAHVDPNAPSGCTLPLSRAAMTSGKDMVELLLDHGADPDQQNGHDCPRFWCEQKEELKKVLVRSAMKKSMRGKTQGSKG